MIFKKSFILGLAISIVVLMGFMAFEGQLVKAATEDSFNVTLEVTGEMTLNCPSATVAMTRDGVNGIQGMTGGLASTTIDCAATTNNAGGYNLSIKASGAPALTSSGSSFADAATTPFYDWSGTVATDESKFGFAVSSTDVLPAFKNNGEACNAGSNISNLFCFRGLNNTTAVPIISRGSDTSGVAVTSTLRFIAEVGTTKNQDTGDYTATITVTGAVN